MQTYTPVQLGTLVPGAQPLGPDEKGVNESFRGFVDLAGERVNAYIKVLNKRELVNEALISTVGRALDLRVPEFYFVQAVAQDLPNSELLRNHAGPAIIGATRGLPHPDLSRRFQGDEKAFNSWLGQWGELDGAISFDEWVANIDRHWKNLLIGSDGAVWLIDHGHCMTGPKWTANDLKPEMSYINKLAASANSIFNSDRKQQLVGSALKSVVRYGLVDIDQCLSCARTHELLSPDDLSSVRQFLTSRSAFVAKLVADKMGTPMLDGIT
jgi:hypothetical protein